MDPKQQIMRGLIGFVIAQMVLVLGIALLLDVFKTNEGLIVALALMSAGLLLAMWWCIDPLVPEAGRLFTGAIKTIVLAVFLVCAVITLYSVFTGQYEVRLFS